jgi:hypothetical protein
MVEKTKKTDATPEEGVVKIDKAQLDQLLKGMSELKEQNQMLIAIADKRQLGSYMARNRKKLPSTVHLREIDGKVVVGWRSVSDYVGKNPLTGVWQENQQTELVFEDGSKLQMFVKEFEQKKILIPCKCTGKIVDETSDNIAYKLTRNDNGKEYTIDVKFVN